MRRYVTDGTPPHGRRKYSWRDWVALTIAAVAVAAPALFAIRWWQAQPRDDVIGHDGVSTTCQLHDHRPVGNGQGYVAILREANCPEPLAQGVAYYVVFVHPGDEPNGANNLVFQYEPGDVGDAPSPLPTVKWVNSATVSITAPGVLTAIQRQRADVGHVKVTYSLGKVGWWWVSL